MVGALLIANDLTFTKRDEYTKSQAIIKVGKTKIIHMLGMRPFQAQSFPSQNRMLQSETFFFVSKSTAEKQVYSTAMKYAYWQFSYSLHVLKRRENLGSRPVLS